MKGGYSPTAGKARIRELCCLFLPVFCLTTLLAAASNSRDDLSSLLEKAKADGSVRVIVALKTSEAASAATEAITPDNLRSKQAAIAAVQESVLNRLEKGEIKDIRKFEVFPYMALEVSASALEKLTSLPEVASVGKDIIFYPSLAQSAAIVGAAQAWMAGNTGAGQTIAIVDTGVDKFHPFLRGKVVSEACYSTTYPPDSAVNICPGGVSYVGTDAGVNCSTTIQDCGHGTHVAGIAAGKGQSFSGIARDASIIAIQAGSRFDSAAICPNYVTPCVAFYFSDVYSSLERVLTLQQTSGLKIASVNLSLGGAEVYDAFCDNRTIYTTAMKSAVDRLRLAGVATIVAAGNNGSNIGLTVPACLSNVVSVGSTTDGTGTLPLDELSAFSNCSSYMSLLAPGEVITSSVPGVSYGAYMGTSMAAPHVAGAWAILKGKKPTATFDEVLSSLTSTGRPVVACSTFYPRIQIDAAVRAVDYVPGTSASTSTTTTTYPTSTTLSGTPTVTATPPYCTIAPGQTACGVTLQVYNPGSRAVQLWARNPDLAETPVTGIFTTTYFSIAVPWIMAGNYTFSLFDMSTSNRILMASVVVTGIPSATSTTFLATTTTTWTPTTSTWVPTTVPTTSIPITTTTYWVTTTTHPVTTTTLPPSDLVLNVSCPRANPGTEVVVPISLATVVQGAGAVAVQADLSFDPAQLTYVGVSKGPSTYNAFKEIGIGVQYPGRLRFLISGPNQNVLGDGILMYLTFNVTSGIPAGTNIPLLCSDTKAYNFMGAPIPIGCASCSLPTQVARRTLQ